MPTATITCPHCSRSLQTTKTFAAGSRFRCPGCGAAFAVGPRRRAEEPEPARSGGWLLLLSVVGLALLLLGGAGAALAWRFLAKKDAPPVAVAPPTQGPANGEGPPTSNDPNALPDKKDPPKSHPTPIDLTPAQPPPLAPEPPAEPWLPPEQQDKVNAAIAHGVEYLEKKQYPGGMWEGNDHPAARAALPGLTLLECGVPAADDRIQKAARFVRGAAKNLDTTYDLALVILFLDRLGDPADDATIRTIALRLLAGQKSTGGWTYNCPILSDKDEQGLFTLLEATRPRSSLDLMTGKPGDQGIEGLLTGRPGDRPAVSTQPGSTIPFSPGPTEEAKKQLKQMYDGLSQNVKTLPVLQPPAADNQMPQWDDGTDNSNTQFGTLGLWAAGRHGVPMERALALLGKRFQVSQTPNGGWNYKYQMHPAGGEQPAMTGAGLLGLAVGHGVTADLKGPDVNAAGEDPLVEKGMKGFSQFIGGQPAGLYFLWSVERVGMLYGRRTIADKEWYPWGTDFLLKQQQGDGSWTAGGYFGATPLTDTCFALLFLKRANLAKDLSSKLEFLTQVRDKDHNH